MSYNPHTKRWEMDLAQLPQQTPIYPSSMPAKLGILTVASEAGISNLQMRSNDSTLILHETDNLLYYVRTDFMGVKTVFRFRIFPELSGKEKADQQLQAQPQTITATIERATISLQI